jgi:hypothetical protein
MHQASESITLSIVVPVYSGELYLSDLVMEILEIKNRWECAAIDVVITEAIFVLDRNVSSIMRHRLLII